MNKPRYAIIRVDSCPPRKEIDAQFVCFPKDNICSGCRYGDTKEQLVAKVKQAIRQIADIEGDDKEYKYWRIAVGIVEFLGVEE